MLLVGARVNIMEGLLLETTGVGLMVDIMLGAVLVKLLGWTLGMTVGIDVSWVCDFKGGLDGITEGPLGSMVGMPVGLTVVGFLELRRVGRHVG